VNRVKANASRAVSQVVLPFPQKSAEVVPLNGPIKGRGAVSNLQGRYEVNGRERFDDGWTVLTADGSRCAQFEHTIVVTENGAEVLTHP